LSKEVGWLMIIDELARHWWMVGLRGIAAIVFAVLAFAWPGMTLAVLVLLFGAYALVDGVLAVIAAFRADAQHRVAMGVEGVVSILAGLAAFVWPGITALVLVYIIAFWAIVTGVLEIVAAIRLRAVIRNELALIIGGVLSVLFGVVLVVAPGAGALAVVFIIGAYAILFGIALLGLAWRLREHNLTRRSTAPFGGRPAAA
jgi:uncharacterized membrane protein HdeD (DUF308 family)